MAMADLARHSGNGVGREPVRLSEIAARQEISLSYLEQLFGKLRPVDWFGLPAAPAAATAWPSRRRKHASPTSLLPSMNLSRRRAAAPTAPRAALAVPDAVSPMIC